MITQVGTRHYRAILNISDTSYLKENKHLTIDDGGDGSILIDNIKQIDELEELLKEIRQRWTDDLTV